MANAGKLTVLMAFDENDDGDLIPAFEPIQIDTEERAVREARALSSRHAGVIAWSRDADPALGEYGPPVELFKHGKIPDLE
ncbi:hypothetical protein CN138_10545 [Sinorhizobium meliloti]|uniref:hypothetical protein n=1 Tax=Rhizobium meliloti TaxID=382 RepID=UPI000FD2E2B1|nr:hypothetical protein [Sinorhizobium meliloti]RVK16246.1 hypothetical protein CN164_04585 [Sinorhizobium meliloti]RVL44357.1 hypothetical protein CN145_30735 [Sinorhizobium meliloti]RVL72075.1 hypothetical protein CN138_10545 [Sinorhizobium meliloti]RVP57647.1 hypothetical protein CN076_20185 [Sinorhizobium meliloti]RVP88318.1 hypothetical protein CN073_17170 [Sinorhizobium meliloti]